ncbi:GNAT family N-acetyltransferase [Natronobiforma cellulositropha]|uniref:GNAT family N-acetyltransferase n=1 Tax=Natronobiforma cellulositropha TaxID=1679076 RepID=UPI0021D5D417|nr:GNAT family N-acetyltransferase [Natronobiforma cellulositropha]
MAVYRELPEERFDAFYEYVRYAFLPERGIPEYDPEEDEHPEISARRALYEAGAPADADPLCLCAHLWFDTRVRGETHPSAGLSAVASPPEHRRGGHVRQLLEASLEEYRERGLHFATLWPFRYRFYAQYGWEYADDRVRVECPPEALAFATDAIGERGTFRRLEADEFAALAPVYEAHTEGYGLALERDETWWRYRVFEHWRDDPFVYGWERDGEIRAYVVCTFDGELGERTMTVSDHAFVDHESHLAALSFCHRHDSQVETVTFETPSDSSLLDVVPDPDELERTLTAGPMVRLVDVSEALEALSYPAGETERVTIAVEDPLAAWNDGTFTLAVTDGEATCRPSSEPPEVTLDVGTLSQLAVGARRVETLERTERLSSTDAAGVETLGRLFPPEPVYLREFF